MIASVNPEIMKTGGLDFFDSLQKANPAIVIIAIPATDFNKDNTVTATAIEEIKNDKNQHVIIAGPGNMQKTNEKEQYPLAKWLTSISDNTHFDDDVETDNQWYVISESGILYAVLIKGASLDALNIILAQEDMKE